jgi:SWI/SNF-related matrix-associated actin-dependent regulator 1 of chromatin subfamily A
MQLKFAKNHYWVKCSYAERGLPKKAGFLWNKPNSLWFTDDPFKAKDFMKYSVDNTTLKKLRVDLARIHCAIEQSKATDTDYSPPAPGGLSYMPFQRAGIEFAVCNNGNTLIADEMGLGKTIQTIGVMNVVKPASTLIICPATVKQNWQNEIEKWLVDYTPSGIAYGNKPFPDTPIVIINYDILVKFHKDTHGRKWDLLVVDECHYLKNPEAKRTVEVVGKKGPKPKPGLSANKKLFLTGTPIVNRPKEFFTSLNYLDPKTFPSFFKFGMRYCGGYNSGMGWDFDGASHLDELHVKLRKSVMIRRLKKDVLKDLPPKVRQIIELEGSTKVVKEEARKFREFRKQVNDLDFNFVEAFAELAKIRHETALSKVPMVVAHLKDIIESGEKVICFAWHKDVISEINKAFDTDYACIITGSTPVKLRQATVDRFQNDPNSKLFIGNIKAAGTGVTLTAASRVVFAELDWQPGAIIQAEDRAHRIGQQDSVHVQHLVLKNSIDAYMAKILIRKQEVIDKALDGKEVEYEEKKGVEAFKELFENF